MGSRRDADERSNPDETSPKGKSRPSSATRGAKSGRGDDPRLQVEVDGVRRPFMRGIMVHSLMDRGVAFEDAYRTAEEVRRRAREQGVVSPAELAKLVKEILGPGALSDYPVPPANILVSTAKRAVPFSKGTLSQSLLAASLDPTDAFDVAREIELGLLRQGIAEITRSDLRRLSYETLLQRFGKRTAERYVVWRHYQDPDRPIIVLLGGTTGAGKTSLSLEVARRLGIRRVLSTDSIRQIMRIMLSPELMPAIHASSFDAHRHLVSPAAEETEEVELEGFLAQASVVSVGVRAMIDRAVAENTSMIIDGVTLLPGLIDLEAYQDVADVIFLVVATLDEDSFQSRFESRGERQVRRGTHRYIDNIDVILRIQNHFLELAERYDVPIVDNQSIDSSVNLVIRHVVDTLRKKGEVQLEDLL